jgi:hypothetical protein
MDLGISETQSMISRKALQYISEIEGVDNVLAWSKEYFKLHERFSLS